MKNKLSLAITALLFIPFTEFAQQKDTLVNQAGNTTMDNNGKHIAPAYAPEAVNITLKNYFPLLASNLQQEFSKPFRMTRRDWGNFGKFAVTFAAVAL